MFDNPSLSSYCACLLLVAQIQVLAIDGDDGVIAVLFKLTSQSRTNHSVVARNENAFGHFARPRRYLPASILMEVTGRVEFYI